MTRVGWCPVIWAPRSGHSSVLPRASGRVVLHASGRVVPHASGRATQLHPTLGTTPSAYHLLTRPIVHGSMSRPRGPNHRAPPDPS